MKPILSLEQGTTSYRVYQLIGWVVFAAFVIWLPFKASPTDVGLFSDSIAFAIAVMAALFTGAAAEVGQPDDYGDYPAAGGIALIVTAVVTIGALMQLARNPAPHPVRHGDNALAV